MFNFKKKEKSPYWGSNGVKGLKDEKQPETKRIVFLSAVVLILFIAVIMCIVTLINGKQKKRSISTPEIARSMSYDKVNQGEEAIEGTDNVKFDAFFLRDLDEDGYAEGIRGTCKEIGKEDTLYMELNVQTAGVLKDAKITVNGQNFYLQTALPKDEQLKNNYIGNNTKEIEFNEISNGTQKLITGVVRSGDYTYSSGKTEAIGNDVNKYSVEDNSITLTGTYVTEAGEEIAINKTVPFTVDWYGKTRASIYSTWQSQQLSSAINTEKNTFTMNFDIRVKEELEQLILGKLAVSGTIPDLNGYAPSEVRLLQSTEQLNYDQQTKQFSIEKQAGTSSISRDNTYEIQVVYPLEAYEKIGDEEISLTIPVQAYYEGYNNPNSEFTNPYKSNIAKESIVKYFRNPSEVQSNFYVRVGKYMYSPYRRDVVLKNKPLKLYNGKSEKETDDTYTVTWGALLGTTESTDPLVLKENATDSFIKTDGSEESMDGITNYAGIYFGNIKNMLGEDGYIKVYNDETDELLETFDKTNVNKYSSDNPYKYEKLVKKVRIETSATKKDTTLFIYHVKELDDDVITEKYERGEFDNLQYIKSELNAHRGSAQVKTSDKANYEASMSIANIQASKDTFSTQETEKNLKLTIQTQCDESSNLEKWTNGTFLVKLPEEVLDVELNDITINNEDVKITNHEIIEQDGSKFIKITTENDKEASYNITIDLNITPDPRKASVTKDIELYASNENASDYYYKGQDAYDVNNNLNTTENVNKTTKAITFVAPSSLLTNQMASEFDEKSSTVISPQIAEIKPQVASVDQEVEEKTAKIGVIIKNNYSNTISDIKILGKIPFEGNTYTLTGSDLNSQFSTKMTNAGIQLPEQVANVAKVYYSENTNPSNDLNDESNVWKTADQVENWDNIKTYIIDLSSYVMPQGEEMVFNYVIKIPNGLEYNKVAYSHHGVYFSLDTSEGKYKTQTQSNRIGFKIAEKYNLQLTKYQMNKNKVVPGATYKITEDGQTEGKTATTDQNGVLIFKNLYVEKTYSIEEVKSPSDYELNNDVIKFIGHVDGNKLNIEKIQGTVKDDVINVQKNDDENYNAVFSVEDEVKAGLRIIKKQRGTETTIKGARFKILGDGLPTNGRVVTTDKNGVINTKGLKINSTYDLVEVSVKDYYLADQVKFKIVNNDGNYELQILRGTTREDSLTLENDIPIINLTIDDDKIPTYDLEIVKIKKSIDVNVSDKEGENSDSTENVTYLQGAKFNLYKDEKKIGQYETGADGKFTITDLYQYIDKKDEKATYTLKETSAPDGYAKVKDITFKVKPEDGTLKFINIDSDEAQYTVNDNVVSLIVADSPSFKLIKKDGETGELLANVKFAIYNTDNGQKPATNGKGETLGVKENINGRDYYVLTTDANGEITADLPEGYYKAVELQAPDKYDISDSVYYFGIGCASEGDVKTELKATWVNKLKGNQSIWSVTQTTDGGYINVAEAEIAKFNAEGEKEWDNTIGTGGDFSNNKIMSVAQTTDEGCVIGGYSTSSSINLGNGVTLTNNGGSDGMLIKYNAEGETEWAKSIGGNKSDIINSVFSTIDGGCIVGGYFDSNSIDLGNGVILNNNGSKGGMLIKYNADGEVEWARSIGNDSINSVSQTTDGGYIVGGYFESSSIDLGNEVTLNNNGKRDSMIIKYNVDGEVEWAKSIGGSSDDLINSVSQTTDEGYIVEGYFESSSIDLENGVILNNNGERNSMVIKYNAEGEMEWAKVIGGSGTDQITSILQTKDDGYIVSGNFTSSSIDLEDGVTLENDSNNGEMLIKYNSEGKIEWARTIKGEGKYIDDSVFESVFETTDGGYIVGGYFESRTIDLGDGIKLNNNNWDGDTMNYAYGVVIKYSSEGVIDYVETITAENIYASVKIRSIIQNKEGDYIIGGNTSGGIKTNNETISDNVGGVIIKLKESKKKELFKTDVLDSKVIEKTSEITSIKETTDGGHIAVGSFDSSSIDLKNGVIVKNNGERDGLVIKYNEDGETEWAKAIGGNQGDFINSVSQTTDGGYIVGGYFESEYIDLGNGVTLNNNGNKDGMIIKYDSEGNIEWAKSIGGDRDEEVKSVAQTADGGCIVGGYFTSRSIDLGNGVTLNNSDNKDGMLIKYNAKGENEWAKRIGGYKDDEINSVAQTVDGGYIIGGHYHDGYIDLGNGVELSNVDSRYYGNGMLIKYNTNGEAEWAKIIGCGGENSYVTSVTQTTDGGYIIGGYCTPMDSETPNTGILIKYNEEREEEWRKEIKENNEEIKINSVAQTMDDGYIVGGYFASSNIDLGNGVTLSSNGNNNGMVIKYNTKGETVWAKVIGGNSNDYINSAVETKDEGYIVGGYFTSSSINLGNTKILSGNGYNGMIIKIYGQRTPQEVQELVVENTRKTFKISTEVQELDGIKGGIISGEENSPYETMKYGDSNTKEIVMTPDENYEIIKITINGEEQEFTANEDGTYTLPIINNITEDKHIVVTYALKDNKITINKVDSETKQLLTGAKFRFDQLENANPKNVIKDIVDNGKDIVTTIDKSNEITEPLGSLTNNGTYYFVNKNGVYVPTNSATYQKANGGSAGKSSTTANSYMKIDLTNYTGKYVVVLNASVSSENNYDFGYATITQNTSAPSYDSGTGRFMKISGIIGNKDYTSQGLDGGKIYYLHLGYGKDSSADRNEDQVKINSVKIYGANIVNYNFVENNGKYESTNTGKDNTVANSYIPIDLTNCSGKYNLTVNAKISSESSDYGYATITENTTRPEYNKSTGRLIYISGNKNDGDYTTALQGGKMYYLHLGYYKNDSRSSGDDKFTINSVQITNVSDLYHTEVETNQQGKAITQIPFGKYTITETQAPDGYELNETPMEIEFTADGNHEFTIENKKLAKIIIHHVIKGTDTKLAEDEIYTGKEGESYTTKPKLDLQGYTLEKDTEGNYIIPENATGKYQAGEQEITYYYVPQKVKLIVHHYIQGTETPVPLNDGTTALYVITEGEKGEKYTTQAIDVNNLGENYTLISTPENATGTYDGQEIIVTYYYAQKTGRVITHHYIKGTTTSISKDVEQTLTVGRTYETKVADEIPEHYELVKTPENATGKVVEGDTIVTYYYQPKKYEYTVEYYFEGEKDDTLTDRLQAEYGSVVNTYKDKIKPKYHFDKTENLPLTITDDAESNIIKIYYRRNAYDITTAVDGKGGSISGQGEQPYESILAKQDSNKDIVITPDKGYVIKDITINGDKIQYSENEDGTVKLPKFKTIMEDKHVVATFRKLFSIVKQGEEETTLLPGAKFTIKDENGNELGQSEEINGQEMKVITTDSDGRIDLDLAPGKYTIVEVQAPENYILPENEADRTYTIEIDKGIEEIRKLKKNWTNLIEFPEIENAEGIQAEMLLDKGVVVSGGIHETATIKAENTVDNKDIEMSAVGIADGIIVHTDENGKIKWVKQIKSANAESANMIADTIQTNENEYMSFGVFMGTITIPAEETTSGQEISITSSSQISSYILKYNSDGKVELLTMLESKMEDIDWAQMINNANGELTLLKRFQHFEVPAENTVTGETISIDAQDSQNGGTIVIKLNSQGKVISAKEQLEGNNIEGMGYYSKIYTIDGGHIQTGSIDSSISIPAEDTTDGNAIKIDVSTEEENDLGSYGAVFVKYNIDGKVEYLKRIESTDTNIKMLSLGYINTIDDGYLGVVEYYDMESKETKNALVKFNKNLEIKDMIDIDETKSSDDIQIKQQLDGTYSILNTGTGELSNYENAVIQEAVPAKEAPTLTVKNELKKYQYKVEYYYDGELDETQTETSEAKYGKTIEEYQDKVKENYVLAKTENLPLTITNDPEKNVIKIYYATKAEATVQYIDKTTGEVIEENTEQGYIGKKFETMAKNFKRYVLVKEPEQKTVEMQGEKIVLKYYYVLVSSGVVEKHVDINSGELLANETYEGLVGDEYETKEKEIDGYDLVKEKYPEKTKGTMEEDVITVTYYYVKKVTVTVQYIDVDTNEKLTDDETITGHEGDEYRTDKKTIDGYDFVRVTEDESGEMTENKTIIYYYKKVELPEPDKTDKTDNNETPGKETDVKTTEQVKNTDPTIADRRIPNAGLNKVALVLSVVTFVMIVFTYISYRKYKILERKFGSKK